MTHSLHLPIILVVVAVVGLILLGVFSFSKKRKAVVAEPDPSEVRRIQERLASSNIARRVSGSRRKVVAIRPPVMEDPLDSSSGKPAVHDEKNSPADGTDGH